MLQNFAKLLQSGRISSLLVLYIKKITPEFSDLNQQLVVISGVLCVRSQELFSWLALAPGVAVKTLTIRRPDWGWRIHFQNGPLTWLLTKSLTPRAPAPHIHRSAEVFALPCSWRFPGKWLKRQKQGNFMAWSQKSHTITFNTCHSLEARHQVQPTLTGSGSSYWSQSIKEFVNTFWDHNSGCSNLQSHHNSNSMPISPQPCQHLVFSNCSIFLNQISLTASLGIMLYSFGPFWFPLPYICFSSLSIGLFIIFGFLCSSMLLLSNISAQPYF